VLVVDGVGFGVGAGLVEGAGFLGGGTDSHRVELLAPGGHLVELVVGGLDGVSTVVVGTVLDGALAAGAVVDVSVVDVSVVAGTVLVWTVVVCTTVVSVLECRRAGCAQTPVGSVRAAEPTNSATLRARTRMCRVPEWALITEEARNTGFASHPREAFATLTQPPNTVNRTSPV
jgi:hypothetical protein